MIGGISINIIEQLYYGNIEPQEITTESTQKLRKQLSKLTNAEEDLYQKLNKEEKEQLRKYSELCTEFSCLSCADAFTVGFRLGMQIAHEAFSET
ncbi:MAG: hypothetical protein E7544_09060 [Ruminococcaceae bacterium]|nr:hypothetical protein [Oscillospiraceae bacterium]